MSRCRNISPGTFLNETLAECDPLARVLYTALWCEADREGRLEDRPKRIKARCLPYDDCDINALLNQLAMRLFIVRYTVGDAEFIAIPKFCKHQNPHHREKASVIPAPDMPEESLGLAPDKPAASSGLDQDKPRTSRADSLSSDSLNLIPSSKALEQQAARSTAKHADRFEEFWASYPVKKGRANALKTWAAKKLDAIADQIIDDVKQRIAADRQWLAGYVPHGSTYINRRGWEDAIEPMRSAADQRGIPADFKPRANDSFTGKKYTGTPLTHLAPEFRAAVKESLEKSHAA